MAEISPSSESFSEGFAEPLSEANQDALDDLLVAIEAGDRRLGIFIAVCDDPQLKEEIIGRYERALAPTFRHYRLTLEPEEPSLKGLLSQQVQADAYLRQGGRAVMTVLGAEGLRTLRLGKEQSQQEAFFGYLQWTREGLQDFPFAVVLWVTYQLQEQLSRQAPDFWSWRRDVVRFVSPKRQAIPTEELTVLWEQPQFAELFPQAEELGSTVPIADLEVLIGETARRSPGSRLLTGLYLQVGRAYVDRVERGAAQDYKRDLAQAKIYLKQAVDLLESSDSVEEYASGVDRLARTYELQGRYSKAEPLYVEALEIRKTELGDRHPDTALSLNNLAELYRSQGRYSEAKRFCLEALEIRKTELGDRHPDTATSLNNLAWIYYNTNRLPEAAVAMSKTLDICEEALGPTHPDTISSRESLKTIQKQLNQKSNFWSRLRRWLQRK